MKLSLKLLESDSEVRKSIFNALVQDISITMSRAANEINNSLQGLLADALRQEPEYQSLMSGSLRAELGIANTSSVDSIVDKLSQTVNIQNVPVKYSNMGLSGGFIITAISSNDIGGLIGDNDAMVEDSIRGYNLPWLEWLTLKGTSGIIKDYQVSFSPGNPNSRTGMAVMISDQGSEWRVPAEFAGVIDNNWTTRAIERIDQKLQSIIIRAIERHI